MDDARRKQIQRALTLIGEAKDILEVASSQEQDDFDNMPKDLQDDEVGQRAEETVEALERAAVFSPPVSCRRPPRRPEAANQTERACGHGPAGVMDVNGYRVFAGARNILDRPRRREAASGHKFC